MSQPAAHGLAQVSISCSAPNNTRKGPLQLPAYLCLALGGLDEGQRPGFNQLIETLANGHYPNPRMRSQVFAGEGHSAGVIANTSCPV
jgi:hypothetical protein